MVSQRDVAKVAGVSSASVSRYINNHQSVSEDVGLAIQKAIDQLGYRVDYSAQVLKTGKFSRVTIICPRKGNFYTELISTIEEILSDRGYYVNIYFSRKYGDKNKQLDLIKNKQSDGFIIFPRNRDEDAKLIKYLTDVNEKFVVIDHPVSDNVCQVVLDNYKAGRKAAEQFIAKKRLKPIFIWGVKDLSSSAERFRGFYERFKEEGIEITPDRQVDGEYSVEYTYCKFKDIFSNLPDFDCVFASNDLSALGFIKIAGENKKFYPRDYHIIGYDNEQFTGYLTPTLSTFQQPLRTVASISANMLVDQIESKFVDDTKVVLEAKFIERNSG